MGNEFPNIVHQFNIRDWLPFADVPEGYFKEFIIEFYASYQARQDAMNHKSPINKFPNLQYVMVRGVEIDVTPDAINPLF